jgi:hypothetical protein
MLERCRSLGVIMREPERPNNCRTRGIGEERETWNGGGAEARGVGASP